MQRYSFAITWSELDQNYVALCPEFLGLSGLGNTAQEAIAELQVALELAVETYEAEGWPLPGPQLRSQYSGKLLVRLPKSLHATLAQEAETEGVSLNTHVVSRLSAAHSATVVAATVEQSFSGMLRTLSTDFMRPLAAMMLASAYQQVPATQIVRRVEDVAQTHFAQLRSASATGRVTTVRGMPVGEDPPSSASVTSVRGIE